MNEKVEELIRLLVKGLSSGDDLDKDYMFIGETIYTKREIIKNLQERTEIGLIIISDVLLLAIDKLSKGKQII